MATPAKIQEDILDLFAGTSFLPTPEVPADLEYEKEALRNALGPRSLSDSFNFFNSKDLAEAKKFYKVLRGAKTHEEFIELALDARKRMNKTMFTFALTWAVQDTERYSGIYTPPAEEHSPESFIPFETIVTAVQRYVKDQQSLVIPIDPTGNAKDEEYKVAYFREDIKVNSHHWHWHLVYPYDAVEIKDRQGELFYYMHRQMLARYDAERLSVGLKRVVPLHEFNFDDELECYSSHLSSKFGKRSATRPDGMYLKKTTNLVRWRERIMEAIHNGYLVTKEGDLKQLYNENGINLLGAILEASNGSVNPKLYGNLHNMLHDEISAVQDVTQKMEENVGVIGHNKTAVRDPVFFRLHKFVDNVFTELKNQLEPYTTEQLSFADVEVTGVKVESAEDNVITTSVKKNKLSLNYAIHIFPEDKPVEVEYEHLDHDSFTYKITVRNNSGVDKPTTARIFMAPKFDENGDNLKLEGMKPYFIELDKFLYILRSGENNIIRRSCDSTVTIKSIPTVAQIRAMVHDRSHNFSNNIDDYCSCGWPHHLLVPRGTHRGMIFRLFVMFTDYNQDHVELSRALSIDRLGGNPGNQCPADLCRGSLSYCGAKNSKYPDKRAMGFPFDRPLKKPPSCVNSATEDCVEDAFKTSNMFFSDVTIRFTGSS